MMKILRFCLCSVIILLSEGKLHAQCNADFNYNINLNTVNCYPKDSIAGAIDSWQIQNDSLTSYSYTGYNFYYHVPTPGTYKVTHIIYDSANTCSDTATKSIDINFTPTCYASFYVNAYPYGIAVFGKEYVFNPSTSPFVESYSWLIDSVEVGTSSSLYYKFSQAGVYNVCLKVKTTSGCEASYCEKVIAFDKCKDSASVSFTHIADTLFPHTIDFSVTSPLPFTSYYWEAFWMTQFPGGSSSSGSGQSGTNAVIGFPSPGNYNVRLWQIDSVNACFDTTTQNITVITAHCDTIPQLSFSYSPIDSVHLQTIHFYCNDSSAVQNWNFNSVYDDPTFKVYVKSNNPVYTFPFTSPNYLVCVDEPAIQGCVQHACGYIYVNASTIDTTVCNSVNLSFNYTKNAINSRQVNFNAISNKNISIESWYIYKNDNRYDSVTKYYDSAVINAFDPVYNFPDTGVYNVCVIASYDSSCNKEYCGTVYIHDTTSSFNDTTATSNIIVSFPNPASDKLTFNMQLNNASPISIDIYNLDGRKVYSSKTSGLSGKNMITIPVQNLPSGQYFIDINSNSAHRKSIFQKF